MDGLPDWVVSIIAVAVGFMPGLALLLVGPVVRALHRALSPLPEKMPRRRREPTHGEPAGVAAPRG